MWLRQRLRRAMSDDGFSLIEAVVALTLASIVFTAFAASLLSSVQAVVVGRSVQHAANVGEEALEGLRSKGYDALAMRPSDLTVNEPLNLTAGFNPVDGTTSGATEQIVTDEAGEPAVHVQTRSINNLQYTVRQYVTWGEDSTAAVFKRLTVVVSWTDRDQVRTRIVSTTITPTRSGLPIPDYKFTPQTATTDCVSPGSTKIFGFTVTNNGARDSWTPSSSGGSHAWKYYLDDGDSSIGTFDDDDTALGSGGVVGPIEPTRSLTYWAVADVSSTASSGTATITFTVTSQAYPAYHQDVATALQIAPTCTSVPTAPPSTTAPTVTPTETASPTPTEPPPAQPTSCAGTLPVAVPSSSSTPTAYYLANGSSNLANTAASTPLPIKRLVAPTSTTLWSYANDVSAAAGRALSGSGSTLSNVQEWRYQFANATRLTGTAAVQLYGAPASGNAASSVTYTVTVKVLTSAGATSSVLTPVTVNVPVSGCAGFKPFGASVAFGSGSGTTIPANGMLSVTVTASSPALLGYDTTLYPAQVVLPVKSGGM